MSDAPQPRDMHLMLDSVSNSLFVNGRPGHVNEKFRPIPLTSPRATRRNEAKVGPPLFHLHHARGLEVTVPF